MEWDAMHSSCPFTSPSSTSTMPAREHVSPVACASRPPLQPRAQSILTPQLLKQPRPLACEDPQASGGETPLLPLLRPVASGVHSCALLFPRDLTGGCAARGGDAPATFQAANPQGSAAGPAGLPASGSERSLEPVSEIRVTQAGSELMDLVNSPGAKQTSRQDFHSWSRSSRRPTGTGDVGLAQT